MLTVWRSKGIDDNQPTGLLQILIPPAEAIEMVSVSTSNHDPDLGRGTGAITRSEQTINSISSTAGSAIFPAHSASIYGAFATTCYRTRHSARAA